ncbi:pectin lyase-like protein, partial [Corynespora cassiicola Philippines]
DLGGREFDRGERCNTDDTGTVNSVFALGEGATIRNGIIGSQQSEGIHCRGGCNIENIWFRDVCEDAITALRAGTVRITGGGAQNADDKVVQANGRGEVIIRDYTVVNVGKVYRSCGNCGTNSENSPRRVVIEGLRARGVGTNVVGINSNFGDIAEISGICGTVSGEVCQQFNGVNGGTSRENNGKDNCRGAQGKVARGSLPPC